MPTIVDESIYIQSEPKGFSPTGYIYNLNHPQILRFYKQFKAKHGLSERWPISDEQRRAFDRAVTRTIDAGVLIVKKEQKNNESKAQKH